ncbi:MAG: hypothetical protein WCG06_01135 [Candidatus Omnitrophota bacterium]
MNKLWVKFGVIALTVLLVVGGFKNMIVQTALSGACKAATGLELKIGRVGLGLIAGHVGVKDLRLLNPPSYKDRQMLWLPEFVLDFDMGTLFAPVKHVRRLRLNVGEFMIIRDQKGRLNLEALKPAGGKKTPKGPSGKAPQVQIDELELRIDRVVYKDYTSGTTQTFNLNINDTYRDVRDVRVLLPILMSRVLTNSALGALVNFDTADLLKNFQASGVELSSLGLDQIGGLGGSLSAQARSLAGKMPDMEKTAESAIKKFGDIFGALSDKK